MAGRRGGQAAFAEESAEVEVLFANMDKLKSLTKKIQGSMNRLETSGQTMKDAVGPMYSDTQRLQTVSSNIDKILVSIERVREPLDRRNREERILQSNPKQTGLNDYMASLDRTNQALGDLKTTNLRSNQQAIAELNDLLTTGAERLQDEFRDALIDHTRPVEPLHFLTKKLKFPEIPQDAASRLRTIHSHILQSLAQAQADARAPPTLKMYAELRGGYMANSLRNLGSASISTARKTSIDAIYRSGTNGIGIYSQGLEGMIMAEYASICHVFPREEWSNAIVATCSSAIVDLKNTLTKLDAHVRDNMMTDCFLGFEMIDIVTRLAFRLESNVDGNLKKQVLDPLKPVRETAKVSVVQLYEEPRTRVQKLVSMPFDGASIENTKVVVTRFQQIDSHYLQPVASVLTSIGAGAWASKSVAGSTSSLPLDVGADGKQLFSQFASDTLDGYVNALDAKSSVLLKNKSVQGVFLLNNVAVIDRMIRNAELSGLLNSVAAKTEVWRKKGTKAYMAQWIELSQNLMEAQHTSRARPASGSGAGGIDSSAIVKSLSKAERETIKENFKNFTTTFDTLIEKHKSFRMEPEVRAALAKEVLKLVEPLYNRFWDRYHEIDKGRAKYIKHDKNGLNSILRTLAS